jgi:BirA family biotin operon repressor/biotin-[acetyl-CoA-carboxylase] ligase
LQNNTFSTLFVGQNLIKLLNVDSTNNYLRNLTSNSEPLAEGTVILAENQFAGRGQREAVWQAEPGKNLTFSIYLKPNFLTPLEQFSLTIVVSSALQEVLQGLVVEKVSIKWPNDIYIGDRKVAGVLIENVVAGRQIKHAIIGIGLNVNQQVFPQELADYSVSLKQILHVDVDRRRLLHEICVAIEASYLVLKGAGFPLIRSRYLENLYRLNQKARFRANGSVFDGYVTGCTAYGLLKIRASNNEELEFGFKEIEFVK